MRRLVATFAIAVGLAAVVAPGVASAHAILDSSSPTASAVLTESPSEIILDFNESVESSLNEIRLFDAQQREVVIGRTQRRSSDPSVIAAEVPELDDGLYVVVWHAVSADGHPVNGAFPFEIGTRSSGGADQLVQRILTRVDSDSPLGNPLATARFLAFVGTLLLIGAVVMSRGPAVPAWTSLGRLLRASIVVFVIGSTGVLLLQGPYASGRGWGGVLDAGLVGEVVSTRIGLASLVRLALAVVWAGLAVSLAHKNGAGWRNAAVMASFLTAATWSVSGHPSAGSASPFWIMVDLVHVCAVAAWAGGLATLWWLRHDAPDDDLTSRFSRIATVAMPVAVLTGSIQGVHIVGGIGAVTGSSYGRLLLVKVALVLVAVVMATRARRRIVASDRPGVFAVVRTELAVLTIVLALTSLIVGTSPNAEGNRNRSFNVTLVQSSVVADIAVEPARAGAAQVHVTLTPPGGSLTPVSKVRVQIALPSRGLPAIPVDMLAIGPNHWSGIVQIPYSGAWTFESRVTTHDNRILLYRTTLDVTK